eukprot:1155918-Pelagomonas_calceolata.AAC.5
MADDLLASGVRLDGEAGCVRKGEGLLGEAVNAGNPLGGFGTKVRWGAEGRGEATDNGALWLRQGRVASAAVDGALNSRKGQLASGTGEAELQP